MRVAVVVEESILDYLGETMHLHVCDIKLSVQELTLDSFGKTTGVE